MKKNLWIKVGVGIFLAFTLILIITGQFLIAAREKGIEDGIYSTLTSKTTQRIVTENNIKEYNELSNYINPEYADIYIDGDTINEDDGTVDGNQGKYAFKSINRESYNDYFLTDSLNWDYLASIITEIFGATLSLNGVFETPQRVAQIIMLEKGWEAGLWNTVVGKEPEEEKGKQERGLITFDKTKGIENLQLSLKVPAVIGLSINLSLPLFTFDDYFTIQHSDNTVEHYDFSDGLQSPEWIGDESKGITGIQNWNKRQVSDFVSTLGISLSFNVSITDFSGLAGLTTINNVVLPMISAWINSHFGTDINLNKVDGDTNITLNFWFSNYKGINPSSWEFLNNSTNTYQIILEKLGVYLDELKNYSKEELTYYTPMIEGETKKVSQSPMVSSQERKKEEQSFWGFKTDKNDNVLTTKQRVNSVGEAFLFHIYNNVNYGDYFDKALNIDYSNGLGEMYDETGGPLVKDKKYYDYRYIPQLKGERVHNFEYDISGRKYEPTPFRYEWDGDPAEDPAILWVEGQGTTSFSNFMTILDSYNPFLRAGTSSDVSGWPIDQFYHEISAILAEGVKLDDLNKPNAV